MSVVRFERDGDLGAVVLCSPPNWLSHQFSDDLAEAVHQVGESDIRALLIRAEGEDFSVGGAVNEWPDKDQRWFRTFVGEVNASYRTIEALQRGHRSTAGSASRPAAPGTTSPASVTLIAKRVTRTGSPLPCPDLPRRSCRSPA